jgi:hypothetical protein
MADAAPYENWVPVYSTGTDYEADLVRDRLDDSGLPAVVLTQRDHAFNLTMGNLAPVHVLVPPDRAQEAVALLQQAVMSDEELTEAALNADLDAPPAHDAENEARLDSGTDHLSLDVPDAAAASEASAPETTGDEDAGREA